MREIQIIDLLEAKKAQQTVREQLEERERKKENTHLHDSIAWLKIAGESCGKDVLIFHIRCPN